MHAFLTTSLNQYQGTIELIALLAVLSPFLFPRVRKFFSRKDLNDRMDVYESNQKSLQASIEIIVKELTQNGGVGGLKTSTMKDNIGKALRDIAAVSEQVAENNQDIKELKTETSDIRSDLSRVEGTVQMLVTDYAKG